MTSYFHGVVSFTNLMVQSQLNYLVGAALVVALAVVIAWLSRPRAPRYHSRQELMSPAEIRFFRALVEAAPRGTYVCVKPRLGDLLQTDRAGEDAGHHHKINQKHVDFLLIDKENASLLLAIELDDRSHEKRRVRKRDAFVDSALGSAGIPILHVRAASRYEVRELRSEIAESLSA